MLPDFGRYRQSVWAATTSAVSRVTGTWHLRNGTLTSETVRAARLPGGLHAYRACLRRSAAIRSAIMIVGMWVLADGMSGITDASATDRPSIPWTAPAASTTEPHSGAGPMAHVPTGW